MRLIKAKISNIVPNYVAEVRTPKFDHAVFGFLRIETPIFLVSPSHIPPILPTHVIQRMGNLP